MLRFIPVFALLAALCAAPALAVESDGPVASEPPVPEEESYSEDDRSDFLTNRNNSVYFTIDDLGEIEPGPYENAEIEYKPDASEAHAIEQCEKDPSELNVLTLGILRGAIARQSLEAYRAKKPRPAPDEDPDLHKALTYALSATELCPEQADLFYLLGRVYGAFGSNSYTQSLARDACREALELEPDHAETLVFLAGLEFQDENFEDAVTYFLKAFELKPELFDLNSMTLFGSACLIDERAAEGEAFARQRLNLNPDDGAALFALAQFQRALGKKGEALITLRKAANALAQNAPAADYANKVSALWEAEK